MNRDKQIIKVSIYWIITNLILVWFKAAVWFIANSIAIILDAVNNCCIQHVNNNWDTDYLFCAILDNCSK